MSAPTEGGAKRAREEESDDDMVGPAPPPPGAADDDDEKEVGPAMPPKAKKKKTLAFEQVYLDSMPSASMYEKSYMHRDDITCVAVTPGTDFFITGSEDGHLKFWKKRYEGIEFVKHFRSHVGPVVGLSVSADGLYCATIGHDNSAKIYDVVNFDMTLMLRLPFAPTACEFVYEKGEAQQKIAVADATGKIHVYDAASGATETVKVIETHRAAVRVMKYNAAKRVVISADDKGVIEYWSPSTYEFPQDAVSFRFKLDTDLYALAKAKTKALTLEVSPDGEQFTTTGPDMKVRVFRFSSGKLRYVIDESLESANDAQRSGNATYALEDIDFGRRVAVARAIGRGLRASAAGGASAVCEASGLFMRSATRRGVEVVNLVTNRCARIVGKVENTERFARLAMFQGVPQKDKRSRGSGKDIKAATEKDPTLVCSAFQKSRLYLFTRREPEDGDDAGGGRDVFNEKPAARGRGAPPRGGGVAGAARPRPGRVDTPGGGRTRGPPRGAVGTCPTRRRRRATASRRRWRRVKRPRLSRGRACCTRRSGTSTSSSSPTSARRRWRTSPRTAATSTTTTSSSTASLRGSCCRRATRSATGPAGRRFGAASSRMRSRATCGTTGRTPSPWRTLARTRTARNSSSPRSRRPGWTESTRCSGGS